MRSNGKPYGPANPHPLSQLRTELVWEGKYDEYGNRREGDIAGLSMPMQKIETIDQPRASQNRKVLSASRVSGRRQIRMRSTSSRVS
jgi:hypothetical protein